MAWSEASGRCSLPASTEDVAAYLEDRSDTGASPSTLRVAAAAIARSHRDAGYDAPVQLGAVEPSLDDLMRDDVPVPTRALPLDLDCYLAIRRTARESRLGRGGRPELPPTARRRGAMDVAMIGLMRDGRLRVSEAADLTWGDVQRVRGGSGRVRVMVDGETSYREVSADTMKLLSPVRRRANDEFSVSQSTQKSTVLMGGRFGLCGRQRHTIDSPSRGSSLRKRIERHCVHRHPERAWAHRLLFLLTRDLSI